MELHGEKWCPQLSINFEGGILYTVEEPVQESWLANNIVWYQ